jgi:pimeloyl-ACP methyl ester carboxylesterase
MADEATDSIASLGYSKVDVLGFSIGGAIAQQLLFRHSGLVRKCTVDRNSSCIMAFDPGACPARSSEDIFRELIVVDDVREH